MKLKKFGFTLAEMLICLAIISVVVGMVIPTALTKKPAKNKAMFRKAYYNLERAVYEIVNNEAMFPDTKADDFAAGLDHSTLFAYYIPQSILDDPTKIKDDMKVEILPTATKSNRDRAHIGRYFCSEIAKRMNTSGQAYCATKHTMPANGTAPSVPSAGAANGPSFVTNDGVMWYINALPYFCVREEKPDGTVGYRSGDTADTCHHDTYAGTGDLTPPTGKSTSYGTDFLCFQLDVNGEAGPNTFLGNDPDRFRVCVYYDGRIEIPKYQKTNSKTDPSKESEYLESNRIVD